MSMEHPLASNDADPGVYRPKSREVHSRGKNGSNKSNRILEPLFPQNTRSDLSEKKLSINKSINFYNNIPQPKLDMIHEDGDIQ